MIDKLIELQKDIFKNDKVLTVRLEEDEISILMDDGISFLEVVGNNPVITETHTDKSFKYHISSKVNGVNVKTFINEYEYQEYKKAVAATTTKKRID